MLQDEMSFASPGGGEKKVSFYQQNEILIEGAVMGCLAVVFGIGVTLQLRGGDFFYGTQSSLLPTRDATWQELTPLRNMDFDSIESFRDVYNWAQETFVEDYYKDVRCARKSPGGKTILEVMDDEDDMCASSSSQRPVHLIRDTSFNFMDETFVRLTVQHACFEPMDSRRWVNGYPYTRSAENLECANSNCASQDLAKLDLARQTGGDFECRRSDGSLYNPNEYLSDFFTEAGILTREQTGNLSAYMADGRISTYRQRGGFAIPLGMSAEQARARLELLRKDRWFSQDAVSLVFDWVTYVPNLDTFVYHDVTFSLKTTGRVVGSSQGRVVPLNLFEAGGFYSGQRTVIMGLAVAYLVLVLICVFIWVKQLGAQYKESGGGTFLIDFFKKSVWSISDTVSLVINILIIVNFMLYISNEFRWKYKFSMNALQKYQIPNDELAVYEIPAASEEAVRKLFYDWYVLMNFQSLADDYGTCMTLASVNSFFILVKVLKYFGKLSPVMPLSGALAEASTGILNFTIMMAVLMAGFACNTHVLFGTSFKQFGTFEDAYMTLFRYVIGDFDTDELSRASPTLFIPIFIVFMVFFYLIFVNLYLATMMANYAKTVSKIDIDRVKKELVGAGVLTKKGTILSRGLSLIGKSSSSLKEAKEELTVHNWRGISAAMVVEENAQKWGEMAEDAEDSEEEGAGDGAVDDDEDEGGGRKDDEGKRKRGEYIRDMLFSRVGDASVVQWMEGEEPQPAPGTDHLDSKELHQHLQALEPTGEEFWLDTLVTHIERENGDQLLADCFFTEEMRAMSSGTTGALTREQQLKEFDKTAMYAFRMLEVKSRAQYYLRVTEESEERQRRVRRQCDVVNAYAEQLEKTYAQLLEKIEGLEQARGELTGCIEGILPQSDRVGASHGAIVEV